MGNLWCHGVIVPSGTPVTLVSDGSLTTETMTANLTAMGPPIVVAYQSTDAFAVDYFLAASASATTTSSAAATTATTLTPSTMSSSGSKIALAVVLSVTFTAVVAMLWALLRYRKRNLQRSGSNLAQNHIRLQSTTPRKSGRVTEYEAMTRNWANPEQPTAVDESAMPPAYDSLFESSTHLRPAEPARANS